MIDIKIEEFWCPSKYQQLIDEYKKTQAFPPSIYFVNANSKYLYEYMTWYSNRPTKATLDVYLGQPGGYWKELIVVPFPHNNGYRFAVYFLSNKKPLSADYS